MRSFLTGKRAIIVLSTLGLIAIAVLASGLREVAFRGGQILGEREAQTASLPVARIVESISNIPLWKQLVAWAIIFLMVLMVGVLLSPALRWKLIKMFLRFSLIVAAILWLATNYPEIFRGLGLFSSEPSLQAAPAQEGIPPPAFAPPEVSSVTLFLVGLGVALFLAASLWGIRSWWIKRQASRQRQPMEDLAGIARDSLENLEAGRAWDDVILESYVRMSEVIEKRQGLSRQHAMTTSEFAAILVQAGLPGEAVRTLTRLFESVRYGAHGSSTDEINQAVSCLTTIVKYCGEPQ